MLHRGPVVITTLEEDFKKIGLIAESKSQTEDTDDGAEDGAEGLDETRIMRRTVAGGRKLARTKRTPVAKKMKSKRYYRKAKNILKLKRKKKMRKPVVRRRAKLLRKRAAKRRHEGTESSPIANLIEEVADIVASIESAPKTDAIKSFANIAIISDLLANTFNEWSENLTEETSDQETFDTLVDAAESLADLAEAAAEIATALKEGSDIDGDEGELETLFKEYMEDLLEGMDLYNEASAQMEMDTMHGKAGNIGQKKKGLRAESDDKDADDEKDEDDDEDEDDAEDGKKKMPDFIKKKIAAKGEAAEDDDEDEDEEEGEEDDDGEEEPKESKKRPFKRG
jgi:hypothetical protein